MGLSASAPKVKPWLVKSPLEAPDAAGAQTDVRAYWEGEWHPTPRFNWSLLRPANLVNGPAVIEATTTTLVVRRAPPPAWTSTKPSGSKGDVTTLLRERLAESERTVQERGSYEPELSLKDRDPIGFEVLFTRLLQTVTNAREVALSISASPSTREQGEIIFGLYTPEGDAVCLSTGLMIHVHTMSRAIKWMIENDYETTVGFAEGDYFFNNDSFIGGGHPSDQMLITPLVIDGEIEGWVGGLTHVTETGAIEPGAMGTSFTSRFAEGLIMPCTKDSAPATNCAGIWDILVNRAVRSSTRGSLTTAPS